MATEPKYAPDRAGDWGAPAAATGGHYAEDTIALRDGAKIFTRSWQTADAQAPVLLVLHGLGAHSGWFIDMGNALNARGVTVYIPDHLGFGRSEGPRGHVRTWRAYTDEVRQLLDEVRRRQAGAPVTMLGHSMGALFALYSAADDARSGRNQLAGLILLNPWIKDQSKIGLGQTLAIGLGGALGSSRRVRVAGGPAVMTTNPEATRMLEADPFWVRAQSAAFLYQIGLKLRGGAQAQARDVRAPALVLQAGRDLSVVSAASRACFDALGSADKTWKDYPDYAHDSELEADRRTMDDDIAEWLDRHRA